MESLSGREKTRPRGLWPNDGLAAAVANEACRRPAPLRSASLGMKSHNGAGSFQHPVAQFHRFQDGNACA